MPLEKKNLAACAEKLRTGGHQERVMARRNAIVENLRQKRSIESKSISLYHTCDCFVDTYTGRDFLTVRDRDSVINTSHQSNLTGITVDADPSLLFATNKSCVLSPEVTVGPYYVTGELVRQDVTDGQAGVPLTIDIQLIDTSTCEPLPDILVDFWHCNSTGIYSGVVADGNGDINDASNVNKTFHRGIQQTDSDGVLTFDTMYPGHYIGRAHHIHILSHQNAIMQPNNTITGGTVSHVGQIYFDQDLSSSVEALEPYASNKQPLTTNAEDMFLTEEDAEVDPFVEYVLLGDSVSEGVFGWIALGIDTSASYQVSAAAKIGADGGVQEGHTVGTGTPNGQEYGGGRPPHRTESPIPTPSSEGSKTLPAALLAVPQFLALFM